MPEQGVSEPAEDGYTPIKITGKVQSPWFGASVGMNLAWRFLLDSQGKIARLAITAQRASEPGSSVECWIDCQSFARWGVTVMGAGSELSPILSISLSFH